jgi:preprotein translocase subunit SecA
MLASEVQEKISKDELLTFDYEGLKGYLLEKLTKSFETKMSVVDEKQKREIERILYLQVLDKAWRDHLYQMDILKTGIGLRGYNQKDPLTEYKKESYNLFMELVNQIKFECIKTLHLIQLRSEKEEEERRAMEAMLSKMQADAEAGMRMEHNSVLNEQDAMIEKKVPRNGPCPCGSGKKYKQCCGKSGPKKGLLAE